MAVILTKCIIISQSTLIRTDRGDEVLTKTKPRLQYFAVKSRKKAVSAYFTSKQILPFGFAEQHTETDVLIRSTYLEPYFIQYRY